MTHGETPGNIPGKELEIRLVGLDVYERNRINDATGTFTATTVGPDGQPVLAGGDDVLALPSKPFVIKETDPTQVLAAVEAPEIPYTRADIKEVEGGIFSKATDALRNHKGRALTAALLTGVLVTGVACDKININLPNNNPNDGSEEENSEEGQKDELGMTEEQRKVFDEDLKDRIKLASSSIALGPEVDYDKNPREAGNSAFTKTIVKNGDEWTNFLKSNDPKAQAAHNDVKKHYAGDPEGYARYMSGDKFVVLQVLEDIEIQGTTYFANGEVVKSTEGRPAKAGDIFLIYYNEDGSIDWEVSTRSDCGNLNIDMIIVLQPNKKLPPMEQPPKTPRPPKRPPITPTPSPSPSPTPSPTPSPRKTDDGVRPGPGAPDNQPAPRGPVVEDNGQDNPVGGAHPRTPNTGGGNNNTGGGNNSGETLPPPVIAPDNGTPEDPTDGVYEG